MATYNFQLRGSHVILGIALVLGVMGFNMYLRILPVDDNMRAALRERLLKEYSGRGVKDVARILSEARAGAPIEDLPEVVQRDVQFTSMGAHGKRTALQIGESNIVIRADITVDGGPPPDWRAVRYFRLTYNVLNGTWIVLGNSNAYLYYSTWIP